LIENSIDCDAGDRDACRDVGIDAAFLAIDIIPLGKLVKAPTKSIVGVFKSISELSKKFKLDDIVETLKKRDMGVIGDWFKRHPDRLKQINNNRALGDLFPCLNRPRNSLSVVQNLAIEARDNVEILDNLDNQKRPIARSASPLEVSIRPSQKTAPDYTLDITPILQQSSDPELSKAYDDMIRKIRENYLNLNAPPYGHIYVQFTNKLSEPPLVTKIDMENLYLVGSGKSIAECDANTKPGDSLRYPKNLNAVDFGNLAGAISDLRRGDLNQGKNLTQAGAKYAFAISEAVRFGMVSKSFSRYFKTGKREGERKIEIDRFAFVKDWSAMSKQAHPDRQTRWMVGMGDDTSLGGDGQKLTEHITCREFYIKFKPKIPE
jgi:hypothetical protein